MNSAGDHSSRNAQAAPHALSLHPTTAAAIAARAELESLSYSEALRRLVSEGTQRVERDGAQPSR